MTEAPTSQPLQRRFDPRRSLSAGVTLFVVVLAILLIVFGQELFGLDRAGVDNFLNAVKASPWAPVAVCLLYISLALVGFPQAMLFAGTVAVFGPWYGAVLSWGSTMVSGAVTFFLGRFFGGPWVNKLRPGKRQTLIGIMRRHGILASMIVRWTPSGPFIVVNTLCGASGMAYWKFALGTAIGVVPKLALIAFFTGQLDEIGRFLTSGDPEALVALAVLALLWVGFMLFCRWLYKRLRNTSLAGLAPQTDLTQSSSALGDQSNRALNLKSKA
ncbi:TVP38/TMEM64 family protein [Parvularcula lutaonensis]|uniref:TVP38/TMEM64 family membrane protein n=1 Tax=Parvularcula lutaonensis TaxID=491923 RepID=A0ABV7MEQ9_9PROT|nr:VTT domain-containing protein [Parvularcula lutaonensis]GGY52477.1 hypothetical protein GCM10007148_21990 [Parvularcula lutaonensis]